ncbi:MAG: hypothetical protein KBD07_01860, partial [Candidatus Omnitrophica bacterium]|nr:hypothetical protein [Candidatus Omnitrophota bacterium]
LSTAHRRITQNIRDERSITPAAEWFVDNFYVIEEQILEIHDDLPPKFYQGLPKLAEGVFKGTPRVYGVAWAFVAHTDSRFSNRYPALQGGTVHGPGHPIFMAGVRTVISSRHHAI